MGQYGKLWRENRRYYGAQGKPPPKKQIGGVGSPAAAATTEVDPRDPDFRTVYLRAGTLRNLKKRKQGGGDLATQNILHEWTHANQSDATLADPVARERGAYRLAKAISRSNPQKRKRAYNNLGDFAKYGQFGVQGQAIRQRLKKQK